MLAFAWPWAGLLLLLPLLIYHFIPPKREREGAALWVPRLYLFQTLTVDGGKRKRNKGWGRKLLLALMLLMWLLLVLACARPQWLGEPIQLPLAGRDLLLCVDLSGSMNIADFTLHGQQVSRLRALKVVADDFIARRQGDRIGLILFADKPYVQTPLTFDRQTVRQLLDEAVVGLAGERTAIGDAIGLGVKHLRANSTSRLSTVMILLTDGSNNSGTLMPEQAAAIAAQERIRIHTIGIGAEQMENGGLFSRTVNPSADMDEGALQNIANKTGGSYFRARNTGELNQIYAQIDALEPVDSDARYYRPIAELYPWPLATALVLLVGLGLRDSQRGRERYGS
ncbi:MAG: VWA domain-containing protein [Desulfuromonas sp.]|nr:VWA domain-containing protein [Desulfuromonas sp.]